MLPRRSRTIAELAQQCNCCNPRAWTFQQAHSSLELCGADMLGQVHGQPRELPQLARVGVL